MKKTRILTLLLTMTVAATSVLPVTASSATSKDEDSAEYTAGGSSKEEETGDDSEDYTAGSSLKESGEEEEVATDSDGKEIEITEPYIALGKDLSSDQRAKVLNLMGVTEADLSEYDVIYVTNKEEHEYLDAYLDSSVIGTRSLSSVLVQPGEEGDGLNITTYNIGYCTVSMYKNALITAGLEDADVIVAAPTEISGTAALIGAVKAYAEMNDEEVDTESLEVATNELVVTGDLGEELGDTDSASDLMAYVKQRVVTEGAESAAEIKEIVEDAATEMDLTLTDEQVQKVTDVMSNISELDIDPEALKEQAKEIYNKLQDMGLDIDTEQVKGFVGRLIDKIVNFFKGLFE